MSPHKPATSNSRPAGGLERGSASVELVILLPALFAILFLGLQGALYYHARAVAIAAAQTGARAAATENGHDSDGTRAASDFITQAGGNNVLPGASESSTRTVTTATVTVTGTSLSIIPGWTPHITQTATVPVERTIAPSGQFANSEGSNGGN